MIRSNGRIRVTHQGTLPRSDELRTLVRARGSGQAFDADALAQGLTASVAEVVRRQVEIGVDSINDGEQSKTTFSDYVTTRLGGLAPTPEVYYSPITGRDRRDFPDYHQRNRLGGNRHVYQCVGPLTYTGQTLLETDIANFKAAMQGLAVEQAYLPAVAPGSIEHWLRNTYYPDEEQFLYAIADAMHEEYKAILDAGLVLQIDDPDLADGWQVEPDLELAEYRRRATLHGGAEPRVARTARRPNHHAHVLGQRQGSAYERSAAQRIRGHRLERERGCVFDRGRQPATRVGVGNLAGREAARWQTLDSRGCRALHRSRRAPAAGRATVSPLCETGGERKRHGRLGLWSRQPGR